MSEKYVKLSDVMQNLTVGGYIHVSELYTLPVHTFPKEPDYLSQVPPGGIIPIKLGIKPRITNEMMQDAAKEWLERNKEPSLQELYGEMIISGSSDRLLRRIICKLEELEKR